MATGKELQGLMCGTGEYTTGYVHGTQSKSDKKVGVVALALFELRRLGHCGTLGLVGTNGTKFPGIRNHLQRKVGDVYNLDTSVRTFPDDSVSRSPEAYKTAVDVLPPGSFVVIFTPDDTHFAIARYAIDRGMHVLLTKPPVKLLSEHLDLVKRAREKNVLVMVEYHKRFDPVYADARQRIQGLGDFGFLHSYMSQPKFQLETFKAWAGKSSDISYYLNSHHIDVHVWAMQGLGAVPVRVTASESTGVAESAAYGCPKGTEDTITLMVQWRNASGSLGTAVYTASWAAADKAEVHSQQRFFYLGHRGEVNCDQAHRGYTATTDADGFRSINPLYMAYFPDHDGHFAGHHGYGFKSIERFVLAVQEINAGRATPADMDARLPTMASTATTTAILEAGRRSLDHDGATVQLVSGDDDSIIDMEFAKGHC